MDGNTSHNVEMNMTNGIFLIQTRKVNTFKTIFFPAKSVFLTMDYLGCIYEKHNLYKI